MHLRLFLTFTFYEISLLLVCYMIFISGALLLLKTDISCAAANCCKQQADTVSTTSPASFSWNNSLLFCHFRFMLTLTEEFANSTRAKGEDNSWFLLKQQIEGTYVLHLVSCIQLASKLSFHYSVRKVKTCSKPAVQFSCKSGTSVAGDVETQLFVYLGESAQ